MCAIHYRSLANQARFVVLRQSLEAEHDAGKGLCCRDLLTPWLPAERSEERQSRRQPGMETAVAQHDGGRAKRL